MRANTREGVRRQTPTLRIVTVARMEGIGAVVAHCLKDGSGHAPKVGSVRKILTGERVSRKMLLSIFANAPCLLDCPRTTAEVRDAYRHWQTCGTLPDTYAWNAPSRQATGRQ